MCSLSSCLSKDVLISFSFFKDSFAKYRIHHCFVWSLKCVPGQLWRKRFFYTPASNNSPVFAEGPCIPVVALLNTQPGTCGWPSKLLKLYHSISDLALQTLFKSSDQPTVCPNFYPPLQAVVKLISLVSSDPNKNSITWQVGGSKIH